ncbi:hypothetical protein [Stieleria varia]|uniref:Uncharacterized protein n=1 Tax=Stieleria varia TaxID=2528005 RepID=A0A5C6AY82_9BACT|nr:hypothetical protein [Stieleria varia]TWU04371.1 hypothetical protein Pla52n_24110 [Stieleria varia]
MDLLSPNRTQKPFTTVGVYLLLLWAVSVGLVGGLVVTASLASMSQFVWVALGSVAVSLCALMPGAMVEWLPKGAGQSSPASTVHSFLAGMVIRLFGTVALFALCRYHMAASPEQIAAMTLGWYCWLTVTEVVLLVRLVPSRHSCAVPVAVISDRSVDSRTQSMSDSSALTLN